MEIQEKFPHGLTNCLSVPPISTCILKLLYFHRFSNCLLINHMKFVLEI